MLEPIKKLRYRIIHKILEFFGKIVLKSRKIERLAVSERAARYLFGNKQYICVSPGVSSEEFKFSQVCRDKIRNDFNLSESIVIGFVGRLVSVKNPFFTIDVFRNMLLKNPDFDLRLLIVGDGPLRSQMESYSAEKKIADKICFTGQVDNVSDYLMGMDCLIAPSISEGMPLTIIEAQAAGLPCICSKDRIPNEINITSLVEFVRLEEGAECWADHCIAKYQENSEVNRISWNETFENSQFEIKNAAEKLKLVLFNNIR